MVKNKEKIYGIAIFSLGIIIISSGVSMVLIDWKITEFKQEVNETWEIFYQVDARIKISFDEDNPRWIDLFLTSWYKEMNNKTMKQRFQYSFSHQELGLSANFSRIDLFIYVEACAFVDFARIEGTYHIEDRTGIVRTYTFHDSNEGMEWKIAQTDISNLMWQENPPQEILLSVVLSN